MKRTTAFETDIKKYSIYRERKETNGNEIQCKRNKRIIFFVLRCTRKIIDRAGISGADHLSSMDRKFIGRSSPLCSTSVVSISRTRLTRFHSPPPDKINHSRPSRARAKSGVHQFVFIECIIYYGGPGVATLACR